NLEADLGLWEEVPACIYRRLAGEGRIPDQVVRVWARWHTAVMADVFGVRVWARWHKEMLADMFARLLGGPAAVESLMDVVGRAPAETMRYSALGVHPTPYLRVLINLVLLKRMGFAGLDADTK